MTSWIEMYTWPRAPHDRNIVGLTADKREVECSFNSLRQCWVDQDGHAVVITHWHELG